MYEYENDALTPFELSVMEAKKERERVAILAILSAKNQRLKSIKASIEGPLKEAEDAMYEKTQSVLPNNLKSGLNGQAAKAVDAYLKAISRPHFENPVKRG